MEKTCINTNKEDSTIEKDLKTTKIIGQTIEQDLEVNGSSKDPIHKTL